MKKTQIPNTKDFGVSHLLIDAQPILDFDQIMLLNCHTQFSLRYGILSVQELFDEVEKADHSAFVLADINNTSACMDALRIAHRHNVNVKIGIDFRIGAEQQYLGIAHNMAGFRELNEHLTRHIHRQIPLDAKAPPFENAFVIYPLGKQPLTLLENEYIGVRPQQLPKLGLAALPCSKYKLVILQTSTFRNKRDFNTHRLLRAVGNNCLLSQLPAAEQGRQTDDFVSRAELLRIYSEHPYIIENTEKLLDGTALKPPTGNRNKATWSKTKAEDYALLCKLAKEGLIYRYGKTASIEVMQRMEKELKMIRDLGFCSYFLINWDMIRYAQRKNYYYVGRGSGANSLVAYLLRITDVDPVELDLYFERFINPHRRKPPDFDIDFSWTDRDDITKYLFDTYSWKHTALLGTYSTFKARSVIRELGKVFGLPDEEIKHLQANFSSNRADDEYAKYVLHYANHIQGLPNNLSVHSSGILISEEPITSYTSTFVPPKGYPTTQFDMQVAEDIGLHKFDILSQRGLGKIKDSVTLIEQNQGVQVDVHDVRSFKQDPKIKESLKVGDTIGCFYVESPAMRSLLTKLEADDYLRLVAASSIIRPGVAKSGMMREYILRYRDPVRREKARKELPEFYDILKETYGVMVYQEDVIKVAHFFAGLTLAEADVLRRGMSWRFKQRNDFKEVEDKFFSNCKQKGYDDNLVRRVWEQIESFANFAFAKGHSASYAVESYQALYLKMHYPLEYMVATLNNGGGFYRFELYLHEARLHGAEVELPCVNRSGALATISGKTIRIGLGRINGMEASVIQELIMERENGPYTDLRGLIDRVAIPLEQLCLLIRIGAFSFTGKNKKELLWDARFLLGKTRTSRPTQDLFQVNAKDFRLPALWYHELEQSYDEMELLGFPLCDPFSLLEEEPSSKLVVADLRERIGQQISIVGYLVHRKMTQTHEKASMSFGTLLDLDGQWLDTVQFPQVDSKYSFRGPGCYLITGKVAEEFGFLTIETKWLKRLPNRSIDAPTTRLRSTETYYRKPTTKLSADHAENKRLPE